MNAGPMDSAEVRHLAISLLTAPTARDAQTKIGASNLSNGCEFCLASNMLGDQRETPVTDRAWGGRVLGTAIHALQEDRLNAGLKDLRSLTHTQRGTIRKRPIAGAPRSPLGQIAALYPDALAEYHMTLGTIPGYGEVGTTADVIFPDHGHGIDWKNSDKKKSALMRDFLGQTHYGRQYKDIKISEAEYAKEMVKAEYKLTGYYTQCQLYMKAARKRWPNITRWSLVFIVRDATMWFDNPAVDGYDDPERSHGVWNLDFDYDEAFAEAAWQRGLDIWAKLEGGASVDEFEHHPLCFPCSLDARDAAKAESLEGTVIIPAELVAA